MTYWYIASPYSAYHSGRDEAFRDAAAQAALLMEAGVPVFSPIAHSHPISQMLSAGFDTHETWMRADAPFMRAAKGLIVCMMEGWDRSKGVAQEIETFTAAGKPIVYMRPGVVPPEVIPPQRQIVGLCGYARSGKDCAAQALIADGFERIAFADAVREALLALDPDLAYDGANPQSVVDAVTLYGWDRAKGERDMRRLLQRMGTEAGRNIHGPDCWVNIARRKIEATTANVVLTDVRFPNEAAMVRELGGHVIRIDRPGVGPVNGHASEALAFEPDAVIENSGTVEELHAKVRELCLEPVHA